MYVVLQEGVFETVQTLFCETVFLKLSVLIFFRRKIFFFLGLCRDFARWCGCCMFREKGFWFRDFLDVLSRKERFEMVWMQAKSGSF